jgi:hypothetical protein
MAQDVGFGRAGFSISCGSKPRPRAARTQSRRLPRTLALTPGHMAVSLIGGLNLSTILEALQHAWFDGSSVAMDSLREILPAESAVRGSLFEQLFKIGFFTTITVATIGWVSAFGWIIIRVASWLLA